MSNKLKKAIANKIAVSFLSFSTALFVSGASMAVPLVAYADHTTAHSIEQLQAQIAALTAQLNTLIASQPGSAVSCTFTRDLTVGSRGDDVKCLQQHLNSAGYQVAASGAGSPGNETTYFGSLTKAAVSKWQSASGVSPAAGYFGPISRAKYSSVVVVAPPAPPTPPTPPGTPPPPVPPGTGLMVEAGTQPAASLAPENAARVPFTVIKLTASKDGDVTVNSLTAERTGLAADSGFIGVVLLDEGGEQVGIAKTLNSNHQVVIGDPFVVKAGQTRIMTVGANMDTTGNLGGEAGQVAYFSVVGVNTSATVSGTLPITGVGHTINATLTIGSVTMARGSTDPGSSQTKEVGTTGYTYSAVKVTAGSAEDLYLESLRWNQTGSVGSGDLANIKSYVDGAAYDTKVSSDGKYYTTTFPDKGIKIGKGNSVDVSIKGDVAGGSGRTVDFDLAKRTDVGTRGVLYGYGIIPPQTGTSDPTDDTAAFSSVEDPWYDAAQVTVSAGTINISSSTAVPAQNIAVNLNNQPLGAFVADVRGEPISISRIAFNVTLGSEGANDDVDDITSVTLVDETGAVVAGPADGAAADSANTASSGDGSVTFSDTVTFPTGLHTYTMKGKIGTDIDNNVTIQASSTPSSDFAGTVRGLVTGNSITPSPTSAISLSTMTVKAGSLTVSVSTVPAAQTVIAGAKAFTFANYIFDATGSGEDIRVTTIPLTYAVPVPGGAASDLTNCQLYDGTLSVTSGANVKNPTAQGSSTSFTFDGTGLVLTKGVSKTLPLKCDVRSGATGSFLWGLDTAEASSFTGATGLTSGQTVTETLSEANGQSMTVAAGGTLSAVLDANSPGYKVANSGMTNVELVRIRFSALNEPVDLKQVALQLSRIASNTPDSLVGREVSLWTLEGTKIGNAVFSTQGDFATSSSIAAAAFRIAKDGSKVLVVKADLPSICTSCPVARSGEYLTVDYDGANNGINGNYGTGVDSGSNVTPSSADTASLGVRLHRAYPELAYVALSSAESALMTAGSTANKTLYKFSVKAVGGDVALYKLSFTVSSSTAPGGQAGATTTLFSLYAYTDSAFASADTSFSSNGLLNALQCSRVKPNVTTVVQERIAQDPNPNATDPVEIFPDKDATACNSGTATTTYTIPSGATRWFRFAADVNTVEAASGQESFSVRLEGDAAFPTAHQSPTTGGYTVPATMRGTNSNMGQAGNDPANPGVDRDTNNDFIWSPISTTTQVTVGDFDYTNGYLLPGLPTDFMQQNTFTSQN